MGETSPASQAFSVSPIAHMHMSKPGPSNLPRMSPTNPPKTTPSTKPPLPENPQFGMLTSLWPGLTQAIPVSLSTSNLSFHPQIPSIPPPQLTIPPYNTYTSYSPPDTTPPYQNLPPYTFNSTFSQPMPPYTQNPNPYPPNHINPANQYWSRPYNQWLDQTTAQ
jgi:hypothetical protein